MTNPNSIGVLTFHRCINYGSYWQARCLVEGLRSLGHEAVLLDHHSGSINRREWRCALDPQLPRRASPVDRSLYLRKVRKFIEAFEDLPRSASFDLDEPGSLSAFDLVVVGSDEVWNLCHPWYGGHPTFYGTGIETNRLVSYAASFGSQEAADGLPPFWTDALSRFSSISVRDHNSAEIVRAALGHEAELVLDPCLQFPPVVDRPVPEVTTRAYVCVYGHSFPDWFSSIVRDWARAAGYRLLSIGYRNDWADDQLISAGPDKFARSMAGAVAVVTNFFHGCVFALLNAKPFLAVSSHYRANKLSSLTRLVKAEERLLSSRSAASAAHRLLETPLHRSTLDRIDELRQQSHRFLQEGLAS